MKKTASRVTAWLLSLLMAAGMLFTSASTALAANEGTLNIYKLSSAGVAEEDKDSSKTYYEINDLYHEYLAGANYSVYKIGTFTQTVADGTVSMNYTAVSGLKDTAGAAITTLTPSTAADSIDVTASGLTSVAGETTTSTGPVSITTGLDTDGVYLIKETSLPAGVATGEDFIITVPMYVNGAWTYTVDAFPKNTATDGALTKTIAAINGSPVDPTTSNKYYANIGDTIGYAVSVTVPKDYSTAYTKFSIVDTSSEYLKLQYTSVPVDGVSVTGSESGAFTKTEDYTATYENEYGINQLTITFTTAGLAKIQAGETLSISYDAKILTGADTDASGIQNNAYIAFTKNGGEGTIEPQPTDPGDPGTVNPVIRIYSYGVKKVNENGEALAGATFVLTTKDAGGNYQYLAYNTTTGTWDVAADEAAADHFTTSTTGTATETEAILQFKNLDPSTTYYLVETAAPTGYTKLPGDVTIVATTATTDSVYNTYNMKNDGIYVSDTGYTVKVQNIPSNSLITSLPSTGGTGIYMFLIAGLLLIGGAALLYIRSRKKDNAAQ